MPIFEYLCRSCGRRYEKLSFGESSAACPGCGGNDSARQLSRFAVGTGGGSSPALADLSGGAGCGSCGDPRGPGACSLD